MKPTTAIDITVFGVVQGVGFRPFVYRTACDLGYRGWVKNIGSGVEIHLEAARPSDFGNFLKALKSDLPPLSRIEHMEAKESKPHNCADFSIQKTSQGESFVFIAPDISICANCRREMFTPEDRRFRYPFINCTDCGPRYTIVESLPYDRDKTTMRDFLMCPDCRREYQDPRDRRYHAQPVACPVCGPQVELLESGSRAPLEGGIQAAAKLIQEGRLLAVKGLGGFHLVCDPLNAEAVARLREIKARRTKPLALMARDTAAVERYAYVSAEERERLESARRPIVLLRRRDDPEAAGEPEADIDRGMVPDQESGEDREINVDQASSEDHSSGIVSGELEKTYGLTAGIAPHLEEVGFMLPYTPLHYLLLEEIDLIVATSSNRKDSPIMKDEDEGEGIDPLCDAILTHNRPIAMRADDSVMRISGGKPLFLRRARGYVPYPQAVPEALRIDGQVLAIGAELKDTISVYKNGYVVTSQFLGDLDEYQNYTYFEETIAHLKRLFEISPQVVVTDLHPDFHTTRYAERLGVPHLKVQHHFAHTLGVKMEHGIPPGRKVLGISWDGFGYGQDGTPWGAEFLVADYAGYERFGHFRYVPLPGGDLAARQPWRMALSYLMDVYGDDLPEVTALTEVAPRMVQGVCEMIRRKLNSPLVSSCGRLFDAVSFLTGLAPPEMEYEAEAPMRLEAAAQTQGAEQIQETRRIQETGQIQETGHIHGLAQTKGAIRSKKTTETDTNHVINTGADGDPPRSSYGFDISDTNVVSFAPTIKGIVKDMAAHIPVSHISTRFHNTLAQVILEMGERVRRSHGIDIVALSGGCFLNRTLLEGATRLLEEQGFKVLRSVLYSPNDESISLGQIAYALNQLK